MISAFKSKVVHLGLPLSEAHVGEDEGRKQSPPEVSQVSPQCHFIGLCLWPLWWGQRSTSGPSQGLIGNLSIDV